MMEVAVGLVYSAVLFVVLIAAVAVIGKITGRFSPYRDR